MTRRWARYGWIDKKAKFRKFVRLYNTWCNMRRRCSNPSNPWYYNYGARGITVCDEWDDYAVFRAWALASGYEANKGLELDRIDSDGPYSPDNCRWADRVTQCLNKRSTIQVEWNGETVPLAELCREFDADLNLVRCRYRIGWPIDIALKAPKGSRLSEFVESKE